MTARPKPFLYLASASPRRKEILKRMGIRFRQIPSSYREKPMPGMPPSKLVLEHARGKALKAVGVGKGFVLAADTIVYCQGCVFGKPRNLQEAQQMLSGLAGRSHDVYTGVVLRNVETGTMKMAFEKTRVKIKRLDSNEILNYLRRVNPLDKAGAYAIQMRPKIVEKIRGSYSNVMGLPVEKVRNLLKMIP